MRYLKYMALIISSLVSQVSAADYYDNNSLNTNDVEISYSNLKSKYGIERRVNSRPDQIKIKTGIYKLNKAPKIDPSIPNKCYYRVSKYTNVQNRISNNIIYGTTGSQNKKHILNDRDGREIYINSNKCQVTKKVPRIVTVRQAYRERYHSGWGIKCGWGCWHYRKYSYRTRYRNVRVQRGWYFRLIRNTNKTRYTYAEGGDDWGKLTKTSIGNDHERVEFGTSLSTTSRQAYRERYHSGWGIKCGWGCWHYRKYSYRTRYRNVTTNHLRTNTVFNRWIVKPALYCENNLDKNWRIKQFNIETNRFENNNSFDIKDGSNKALFIKSESKHDSKSLAPNQLNKIDCYKEVCPIGFKRSKAKLNICQFTMKRPTIKKFPKTLYIPYNANGIETDFKVPNLNDYFKTGNGTKLEYEIERVSRGLEVVIFGNKLVISSKADSRKVERDFRNSDRSNQSFILIVKQPIKQPGLEEQYLVLKFKIKVVLMNSVYNPSEQKLYECQALSDN